MAVGIQLGSITDEIGSSDFFHAFFSTISGNLEPDGWGTRFPILVKTLYGGQIAQEDATAALYELEEVKAELVRLPPNKVIWEIEDRDRDPPWGKNISSDITSLANYFVTSTGRDLIAVLEEMLAELQEKGGIAKVVSI